MIFLSSSNVYRETWSVKKSRNSRRRGSQTHPDERSFFLSFFPPFFFFLSPTMSREFAKLSNSRPFRCFLSLCRSVRIVRSVVSPFSRGVGREKRSEAERVCSHVSFNLRFFFFLRAINA